VARRPSEWTSIGIGINVRAVHHPGAAALGAGVSRVHVLQELVPAVRAATVARGRLTSIELSEFAARDIAMGRACREPRIGRVQGIASDGALLIETQQGSRGCWRGRWYLKGATSD
jgi:biotin-(acetyl-CoA carboxylase) ligase